MALDRPSGQDCWHFNTFGGVGPPTVAEGAVFVGGYAGSDSPARLYRVNATTGLSVWNDVFNASYFPYVSGSDLFGPVPGPGILFVHGQRDMYALAS